jgi:alpha-ketoglutarate-dependent taurine dioxygenase
MTIQFSKIEKENTHITIRPLQPSIGAEVEGVDFRQPITDELRDTLSAFLNRYKVLFFRDQDLTQEQHIALGRAFGDLEVHPLLSLSDHPEILRIDSSEHRDKRSYYAKANANWHADTTFREKPSAASILRGLEIPEIGGDTVWANAAAAYEGLSDDIKKLIEGLTAIHSAAHGFGSFVKRDLQKTAELLNRFPPVEHPVVRTHPETGEKVLFVNSVFTSHIVGLEPEQSTDLLRHLWDQFNRPEYQVRFKWRKNSIAFWDNRATQHYAVADYGDADRVVERVTVIGDRPH